MPSDSRKTEIIIDNTDWTCKIVEMTRFVLLIQFFIYLTDLPAEQCPVDNCDFNFCDNNTCSKCDASYYLTDNNICSQCYLNCRNCDGEQCYTCPHEQCDSCINNCSCSSNTVPCSTCPGGYYKSGNECHKCHFHKCTCTTTSYDCTGCLPGYYGSSNRCANKCPTDCLRCNSFIDCSECVSGKYGSACQTNCSNPCDDGTCDIMSGTCTGQCAEGYYLGNDNTCKVCSIRCKTCINFTNCITCKMSYYWGKACIYDCMGCFKNCDRDRGCILGCESNYYSWYDIERKGYICTRCPKHCLECSNSTLCSSCKTGYWGSMCRYNCTGCTSSCHKNRGCTAGCIVGYYKHKIDDGLQCVKCPAYCSICRNNTLCENCDYGYYLWDRLNCVPCPNTCVNNSCYENDGTCLQGCKNNWSGQHCNETCPPNCKKCDQVCIACKIGFHGDKCEHSCSLQCKEIDGLQTCSRDNGVCLQGCNAGYWGQLCNSLCEKGCKSEVCNESTGVCLNGCKGNFYGALCKRECSQNCLTDTQTSRQCDKSSGRCENGCQDGWFGNSCAAECNKSCKDTMCFQYNGTCVYGQADDNTRIITTTDMSSHENEINSSKTVIVILSVVTGLAILVAIVFAILLLKRGGFRFMHRNSTTDTQIVRELKVANSDYQDLNRSGSTDEAYSSIHEARESNEYENTL